MKMKNIGIASALCICMALPSYADIASGASSATCDNSTIGATEGSTDLEANWNANSITVNWYNGDTKITTNTCSYDGAVTIPATPTKAGYTFNGWHVRAAATPSNCYLHNTASACNADPNCYYETNNGCVNNNNYCQTINNQQTCANTLGCLWALDGDTNTYGCYNNNNVNYIVNLANNKESICNKSATPCYNGNVKNTYYNDYRGCSPSAECDTGGN